MRSMLAVLLLATATMAQPEPILNLVTGLTSNLLGGGLLGGGGGAGLLEGLLGGDGLVGGLVSGLLGPLLGGGGGGLLSGLLGGAGGLLGGVDGGQVGDLVTCVLSQLLGQVGGLLDQILGSVLGISGLQGSKPQLTFLEKLIEEIRQDRANVIDVIQAFNEGDIDLDDIVTLLVKDVLNAEDFFAHALELNFDFPTLKKFITSGVLDVEDLADLMFIGAVSPSLLFDLVNENVISVALAKEIINLFYKKENGRRI